MSMLAAHDVSLIVAGKTILDNVSLALPATGAVAIVGPNGAGKSSLLRLLAGVLRPTRGAITLGGAPLPDMPGGERARRIGYVPQSFQPFWDLVCLDLVRLGLERIGPATRADVLAAMRRAGVAALGARRWSTLSGGERARVLMAAALAPDPPILLADEPGASLDIRHRLALVDDMALRGKRSLSVVTIHDLDLAFRRFDRIILVSQGRIVADDAPDVLFGDRILDEVFGMQFERAHVGATRLLVPRT